MGGLGFCCAEQCLCLTVPLDGRPINAVPLPTQVEGDLLLGDLGHGLPLRKGMFDGAISISAVQWLCNADRRTDDPRRRLRRFFETLYASLAAGARAVLQVGWTSCLVHALPGLSARR